MRNASPILSIVVPVRNGKKFIFHALESLGAISEAIATEVIFQDALSTDGTSEIVDAFCRKGPGRHHHVEGDSGQSDGINRGVARAGGRWVTWLCADDVLLPGIVPAIGEAEQAGADVVYGDVVFCQENGMTPAMGTESWRRGSLAGLRLIIQQPGTCIRRTVWEKMGGVQDHLNWAMDYDLFMRIEGSGYRFHRSRHFVAAARIHREAKTSSGSGKRLIEIWSIIVRSHIRTPEFLRISPYLVYLFEFIIKFLESRNPDPLRRSGILGLLHRYFWALAQPGEAEDIRIRFHREKPVLLPRLKELDLCG